MTDRYRILGCSKSHHCCFEYTVVDTTQPYIMKDGNQYIDEYYGPDFETVCECFDEASAKLVCDALNRGAENSSGG